MNGSALPEGSWRRPARLLDLGLIGWPDGADYPRGELIRSKPAPPANGGSCLAFGARGVLLNPLRRRCRENDMTASDLLDELRESRTDMVRLVEAASCAERGYVVVPAQAVKGWIEQDPETWAKVSDWLAASGKALVQV